MGSRRGHSRHPSDFGRKFVVRSNRRSPCEVKLLETHENYVSIFLLPATEFSEFPELLDATGFPVASRSREELDIELSRSE